MKSGLLVLGVIALIVVIGLGWAISVNNRLVAQDQAVQESWAQVQTVYQQRADLVPNLVETVKGFAAQERTVLEEVTRARASVAGIKLTPEVLNDPALLRKFQEAQSQLGGALSRLLVTVERYPISSRTRTSWPSRISWRASRTGWPSSGGGSTRRCAPITPRSGPSRRASWRLSAGFREKPFFEAAPGSEAAPQIKF